MREALSSASAVIMNTRESKERLFAAFPEWRHRPVYAIPNGFDSEDFDEPVPERNDSTFRVAHAGYLHTVLGDEPIAKRYSRLILGGRMRGVNILTRSHVFLLEAISRLAEREPEPAFVIELDLAGVTSPLDLEVVKQREVVTFYCYLSHADTLALLRSSNLLFLPMTSPLGTA